MSLLYFRTQGNFEFNDENSENMDTSFNFEEQNISRKIQAKSNKINPVQNEILGILKNRKENANKNDSPEAKFLLSFVPEMEQMTSLQKIEFKAGMIDLLKKIMYSSNTVNLNEQPQRSSSSSSYMQYNNQFSALRPVLHNPQGSPQFIITTPILKKSPSAIPSPDNIFKQ